MISVEEAISLVLKQKTSPSTIQISTLEALGYILGEDIYAPISLPSFPQSAMDGYAVKGFQKTFQLIGEVQAGKEKESSLEEGKAVRIFTGGAVPINATAVIMQEKVTANGNDILVEEEIVEGKNIRPVGEQISANTLVFKQGQTLNASAIGLLVSLGIEKITVFKKPTISLVSTGNELIELGNPLQYGQIYESNSATLINVAKSYDFEIQSSSKVKDVYDSTRDELEKQLSQTDVLLVSGGISVGDYDFVGKALEEIGVEAIFYKIAQKPGKPLFFGKKEGKYVFALPGNPAAALTCFYVYVLPLLNRIAQKKKVELKRVRLPILQDYQNKSPRTLFLKSKIEKDGVTILEGQASSMLYSFALSDAITIIPSKATLAQNEEVEVILL